MIWSLLAGSYVDRVKNKSGLLGGRTGKDLVIDGRVKFKSGLL